MFETYFRAATPIEELAGMAIGSRPAARGTSGAPRRPRPAARHPVGLRVVPVARQPAGLVRRRERPRGYIAEHGEAGIARLRELYRTWPFFASVLDNAEMSIAKADMQVARRYAGLAPTPSPARSGDASGASTG